MKNDRNTKPKSKKGVAALVIIYSLAVLVLLAIIGLLLFGKVQLPFFQEETEPATTAAASAAPEVTTAVPTTKELTAPPRFEVPDVVGMSAVDAYEALNTAGIRFVITREYSEDVAVDTVMDQSPEGGETVLADERVSLVLSKGIDNTDPSVPPTTSPKKKKKSKTEATDAAEKEPDEKQDSASKGDYLLEGSDSRYIENSEAAKLSEDELTLALNEIYARHGRRFSTPEIQKYFESKKWYKGTVAPENFNESTLNEYELANISTIVSVMEEKGYR